jgi:hypothetical protein
VLINMVDIHVWISCLCELIEFSDIQYVTKERLLQRSTIVNDSKFNV